MRSYLKRLRAEKKLTQSEVAKRIEMTQQNYSLIERGNRQNDMGIGLLTKLSAALEVPISLMIRLEHESQTAKK